jgi:hypothetical protein
VEEKVSDLVRGGRSWKWDNEGEGGGKAGGRLCYPEMLSDVCFLWARCQGVVASADAAVSGAGGTGSTDEGAWRAAVAELRGQVGRYGDHDWVAMRAL